MDNSILSVILNPIRMRIIQALIKNKEMTVQQIAKELPQVPQATLYRHLNKLLKANAIVVVKENKIRGTVEKTYGLEKDPYLSITKELDKDGKEEYLNLFYNYLMILLGDFERYISIETSDLAKDGVTFRSAAIYLSDEEYREFLGDLINAFDKIRDNKASPDRRLRKISTIVMPTVEED